MCLALHASSLPWHDGARMLKQPAPCAPCINRDSRHVFTGLKAGLGVMGIGRVLLSLDYEAADTGAEAALAFAGPCQAISLGLDVKPSTEPAALVLLHQGEPLLQKPLVCCF